MGVSVRREAALQACDLGVSLVLSSGSTCQIEVGLRRLRGSCEDLGVGGRGGAGGGRG